MKLGKTQELKVSRILKQGAYLTDGKEEVLLPGKDAADLKEGMSVKVFIYRDSKDRLIATKKKPYVEVGELGYLKVVSKSKFGYFIDIGLDKDVFLPFKETLGRIDEDSYYLFYMYEDRSERLCVTMNLRDRLSLKSPYKVNDIVEGTIYAIDRDRGIFVAVDNKYNGMIRKSEIKGAHKVGEKIEARVERVLKDGKLTLTGRKKAYKQLEVDAEEILELLQDNGGEIPLGDKSDPEDILEVTDLSKGAFKRAIGYLYKNRKIKIGDYKIELIK